MYFSNAYLGKNHWWRFVLFIIAILLGLGIGQVPMIIKFYLQKEKLGMSEEQFQEIWATANFDFFQINENQMLIFFLLPFVVAFFIMIPLIKKLHGRSFRSLISANKKFDWKRVFLGFIIWFTLASILIFIQLPQSSYHYQFNLSNFIPLFVIALFLIPIQTSFEEVFFRGYFMQGIFLISKNKIVPLIVTTLIFGLMHAANPELDNNFKLIFAYLFLSFMFTFIAILDDRLELPIGIHAANNIFVVLILSTTDGAMKTPSIFRTDVASLTSILPILLPILVSLTFIILYVKYKWRFSILFEKSVNK